MYHCCLKRAPLQYSDRFHCPANYQGLYALLLWAPCRNTNTAPSEALPTRWISNFRRRFSGVYKDNDIATIYFSWQKSNRGLLTMPRIWNDERLSRASNSRFTFDLLFQVPHAKGKISQLYYLHVLVPSAYILGSDEYHVGVGSTINLVCIIENVSYPLLAEVFVFEWSRTQFPVIRQTVFRNNFRRIYNRYCAPRVPFGTATYAFRDKREKFFFSRVVKIEARKKFFYTYIHHLAE